LQAKIVITSEVPVAEIFSGEDPIKMEESTGMDAAMRSLMDDLGLTMDTVLSSSIFVSSSFQLALM